MSNGKLLMLGCIAIGVAAVVGAIISSWDGFALACLAIGGAIEVVVVVAGQGERQPRDPEVTAAMMKATQYGKVETVDLPTSAVNWRLLLLGVPALAAGIATVVLLAL